MATIFGDNSDGFTNELEIINYINAKRTFENLNSNMKEFLTFLFGRNLSGYNVTATKPKGQVKP